MARTHGKIATYQDGCKCDECSAVKAERNARQKRERHNTTLPDGDRRHGVNGYSNYGCRCAACTLAWRRKDRAARARLRRAVRLRGVG